MTQNSKEDIGKRIAATRRRGGLSQEAMSRRSGIDPSYISRIESGKVHPTVRTAMRLAAALRVSPNDLLGPSPPTLKDKPCPVSMSGWCLMDLHDTGSGPGRAHTPETYSSQQLRILRRFTELLQQGSPNLLRALEMLIGEMLKDGETAVGRGEADEKHTGKEKKQLSQLS